jgi:two-component system, LytTR family, response regulator
MHPPEYAVYIAEDEPLARAALAAMFQGLPGWKLIGAADNGRRALQECLQQPPDLLVTDIRMPLLDGLELVAELRAELPHLHVVFITAHDQHAVTAFRLAAVDYLLKPVTRLEFDTCMARVAESLRQQQTLQQLDAIGTPLDTLLRERRDGLRHLVVRSIGRIDIVPLSEIIALHADGNYVDITTARRSFVHRETIKSLLDRLDPTAFIQVHRSAIVALAHVRGIDRGASGNRVLLDNGHVVPVAARYLPVLEKALGNQ